VSVSLGGRVDAWLLPAPSESFVSFNPRLAVILRPSAQDTVKLIAGRAFRAPSTYEQFYQDGGRTSLGSTCCGEALRPETLYAGEVEYTHRFDDEWSLLLSGHLQYAQDFIETLPVPAANDPEMLGLTYSANSSTDQRNLGADVEVRRELRDGWMFSAMLGTLSARYLEAPLPRAPRPTATSRTRPTCSARRGPSSPCWTGSCAARCGSASRHRGAWTSAPTTPPAGPSRRRGGDRQRG
jgi:outer membrane receptor for ferrienterochelin and colicins